MQVFSPIAFKLRAKFAVPADPLNVWMNFLTVLIILTHLLTSLYRGDNLLQYSI